MAAWILAIFNQKGGCTKTMTAMQLAGGFAHYGKRPLVVDMDPQGTGCIWSAQAPDDSPFPAKVISLAPMREQMIKELPKYINDHDVIIIDCPPAIESAVPWAALQVADIGLIPVIPVMDNVWASIKAKQLALKAKENNPTLKTYFLASQMRRGNIYSFCLEKIKSDPDIEMLNTVITQLNAFPESQAYGTTVLGLSKSSDASKQVRSLARELLGKMGIEVN